MQIHDPSEDWLDPRIAATNLLQMLARYRQKDTETDRQTNTHTDRQTNTQTHTQTDHTP